MKPVKNFILLVDTYRRPSLKRNTAGRYRVGAKTPDEATKLLRAKIGFGSIFVYYECDPDADTRAGLRQVAYKEVVQEYRVSENGKSVVKYREPHHANAPRETYLPKMEELK